MKNIFLILLTVSGFSQTFSQSDSTGIIKVRKEQNNSKIYSFVEIQPEFPGGQEKLFEYLSKNIKYSDSLFKDGIKSKFYFEFVVEKDGSISNLKMIRVYNEIFLSKMLKFSLLCQSGNQECKMGSRLEQG